MKEAAQKSMSPLETSQLFAQGRRLANSAPVVAVGDNAAPATQLALDISASPRVQVLAQLRDGIHQSPRMSGQLYGRGGAIAGAPVQAKPKEEKIQGKAKDELHQRRAEDAASTSGGTEAAASSASGLPPQLKSGVESLSGMSMDHVHVNYNSAKPAQLNALAYAQGSEIHVGPGQEQHLPHEAWHVVQQAQGRVQPTKQLKGGVAINDDKGLEHEADVMGAKASASAVQLARMEMLPSVKSAEPLQNGVANGSESLLAPPVQAAAAAHTPSDSRVILRKTVPAQKVMQAKVKSGKLNVAGESHDEYDNNNLLRPKEKKMAKDLAGGEYWTESEFKVTEDDWWYGTTKGQSGDPVLLQFLQALELVNSLGGQHMVKLDQAVPDEAKLLRELAETCIRILSGGVSDRYKDLVDQYKNDLVTLNEKQADAANKIRTKINEMAKACGALYGNINSDGSLNALEKTVSAQKSNCIKLNKEIKDLGAVLHEKTMTQENIRVPRSVGMHDSAQASFATPGIWKIGNNHYLDIIEHIKGFFVKAPKYNLISKKEFNDERDKII